MHKAVATAIGMVNYQVGVVHLDEYAKHVLMHSLNALFSEVGLGTFSLHVNSLKPLNL